jgi:hypothetical protein
MRRMLFARLCATIADVGTGAADQFGRRRKSAHPSNGQGAKISTILAKSNAKLLKLLVVASVHPDHIVGAAVAYLRAGGTGIDTVLQMFGQRSVVLVHNPPW